MWVYIKSDPNLWTVGFYDPDGKWHPESDHTSKEEAAKRTAQLNGKKKKESSTKTSATRRGRPQTEKKNFNERVEK
jgi:hypothetical protein